MRQIRRISMLGLALVLVGGCASGGGEAGATRLASGGRNLIVRSELEGTNFTNVYDAVRRLRPRWLRTRGTTSTRGAAPGMPVFIDNVRSGSTERLESLPIDQVEQVRYVSPSDATTRWGTNMSLGAIEVIMRKRG